MMRFELNGRRYSFDQDVLSVDEAIDVKRHAGLTIASFLTGMRIGDPDAVKSLVWLARRRAGEDIAYDGITFDVIGFLASISYTDEAGTEEGEAAADPTPTPVSPSGTGTTPKAGGRGTSRRSRTTSA